METIEHEDRMNRLSTPGLPSDSPLSGAAGSPRGVSSNGAPCRHLVQFYESDDFLIESAGAFIGAGLREGEGAIFIATPEHREALMERLRSEGTDAAALQADGRLALLDAAETLSRFMLDGLPDTARFSEVIGQRVKTMTERLPGVRAFGEMVALLWNEGNGAAAIRLEELWNELGRKHSFSLYCAYPMSGFHHGTNGHDFARICDQHSRVLPAEAYLAASTDDERFRIVAALQQKACALEAEMALRARMETKLYRRKEELANFVENASVGLHWVGPDGIILWANRADFEMLGYRRDEFVGHHIAEFHADRAVIDDILARLHRGARLRDCEARLKCKDGSIKHVLIDSSVLWENGKFVHTQCFTRDITERKRAEDELSGSEARMRQLLSLMPAAVYTCDAAGRITFFNRRAAELWGREPAIGDEEEKFCGAFRLWLPDGRALPHAETPMAAAINTGASTRNRQVTIERPDGSRVVVNVNIDPLFDTSGNRCGAINVFQDVTEIVEAERTVVQTRKEEQSRRIELETLMEAVPAIVWIAHDSDCRRITGNGAGYDLLRMPRGSNLSRTASLNERPAHFNVYRNGRLVADADLPMQAAARAARPVRDVEMECRFADGTSCWLFGNAVPLLNDDGSVRGVIATFLDITDRKRAEEAAWRLAAIVESSDDAIIGKDLQGTITSWNAGAVRLYGYAAEEVIGQPVTMLIPAERRDEEVRILETVHRGERIEHYETVRRRKDGTLVDVSLTVSPIRNADGGIIGASKIARDITDRKRAHEILERTVVERTAQLRDTVAELEAFSYSIAHDMRAPLRAMTSFSALLLQDFSDRLPEQGRHYARRICVSAERLDRLIQDVLNYSRISRGEMPLEKVDVEKLAREIVDSYPNFRDSGATILIQSPMPRVMGNPAALTQCVSNLLSNAVKFVPPGTRPHIRVWAEPNCESVRFWFEDNGIGISEEGLARIFNMFQRLNPMAEFEGTGIGLTIVRKAVERMGGRVGVESRIGAGSRFWLELKQAD